VDKIKANYATSNIKKNKVKVNETYMLIKMTITCCFSKVRTLSRNSIKERKKKNKSTKY